MAVQQLSKRQRADAVVTTVEERAEKYRLLASRAIDELRDDLGRIKQQLAEERVPAFPENLPGELARRAGGISDAMSRWLSYREAASYLRHVAALVAEDAPPN
jgi:hypothetical protein